MEMLTPDSKYPFLVFDNVIPEELISSVFDEINYLSNFSVDPMSTGTAFNNGIPLKNNRGIWLGHFYNLNFSYQNSPIIRSLNTLFSSKVESTIREYHPVFSHWITDRIIQKTDFLLSIYSDEDFYLPHGDASIYSAVLWVNAEPKEYEGGEFFFHFEDGSVEELESKNNRMVIFPSYYKHEVKQVKYLNDNAFPRCSITAFIGG